MGTRTDRVWVWRSLVGIGVVAVLVAGGLHFFEQQHLRGTSALLDDVSTVRAAVYRAVAVAETSPGGGSPPVQAVADLQRVAPQIARLRAAALPEADRGALVDFIDSVATLERQLSQGGLVEAQVQAALSRPDALSARVDRGVRAILESRRRDLDASYVFVSLVAIALFALAVVSARRTERRRGVADRLLAEREERYRLVVESLQEGVLIYDADAEVQAGNSAAEHVLGMSVEALKLRPVSDWRVVDEQGVALSSDDQPVLRVLATGKPVRDVTLCVLRPGREPAWLVVTATPLRQGSGEPGRGVVVTFSDVTAARATRRALAESESTSAALMNALQDGVFVAQDGVFVLVNASLARMLGHDREAFEGLRFEDVVDPSEIDRWQALVAAQTSDTVTARPHEVRLQGRQGGAALDFEVLFSSATFRGRHAVLGLMRDISERQVARAELNLYRSHLEEIVRARTEELETALQLRIEADTFTRLIADNIPGRLAYWDRDLRCRFVNRTAAEALGLDAGAFIGQGVEDLFGPEVAATLMPRMRSALQGRSQRFELDEPEPAGHGTRRTLHHFVPDARERGVEGFFALALDVTEGRDSRLALQRLNDELVIERDRSAAASTAKSAFLANMSHEIRTPMNAIIGLTHLMRRENPGGTQGERLTRVAVAAQHLLKLLDDILDLSKIDAGKLILDDTDFTLDGLLGGACEMVTDAARAKGVELHVVTDHVPRRLRGDPMRLSQALVNLLGNAVKFIEHGSVTLAAQLLEQRGDLIKIKLSVRDTGPGIEPDKLHTLFDAFEQADSSTTRRFGGTGLGLAITKQLAQLMGGRVGAESEVGVGSTFWIEIELHGSGPPPESVASAHGMTPVPGHAPHFEGAAGVVLNLAAEASLRASHAGARVLLAEDNRINEEVAVTLLTQAGLRVDVAHDGRQAVDMAAAQVYALILMDMQMPLLDGPAAVERIRAMPGSARTPIVAMTASAYVEDRDRCMAAGMNDFIAKPVDPPRLYATIERWLGPMSPLAAAAVPDVPTPAGLDRIEGLDTARGRAFFGGDDGIYRRALAQFCEMYAEGLTIHPDESSKASTQVQRDLHSFAGASSAIGALGLGQEAARLEQELRRGDAVIAATSIPSLNQKLRCFVVAVEACLENPAPPAVAPAELGR